MPHWTALLALIAAFGPATALGSSPAALRKKAFDHFAARDYRAGIEALEAAHEKDPHPEDIYNLAVALEKWSGHCKEALATYARYLDRCPECERVHTAREKRILLGALCGLQEPEGEPTAARTYPPQHVEGWAEVRGQALAAARKAAIADGLRQAVEMVAGVEVAARSTDTSRSRLDGDRERFEQQVESTLGTRAEGYVRRYEVLAEKQEGRLLKVDLVVEVDVTRLRSEVEQIADRIARARFPRIAVLGDERYRGQGGEESEARHLQQLLRRVLTDKGFEVIADVSDARGAAAAGADYLVEAKARTRHVGYDRRGQKEHYAEAALEARLTDLASGALVAEELRSGHSPGSIFSELRVPELTVAHVAGDLGEVLVRHLLEAWARAEKAGLRYRVELAGMRSYEEQGRVFLMAVRRVLGVSAVTERAQERDRLVLELRYPAGVDVSTLRAGILKSLEKQPSLRKVSSSAEGRTLTFRLAR